MDGFFSRDKSRSVSVSLGLLWSVLVDELLDAELLDEVVDNLLVLDVGDVDLGLLWNEIHLSFSLLFLELERDASDWTLLNSLHQVCGETSNLVSHSLGLDDSDIIDDSLVVVEILGQLGVVLLDDSSGGSLCSLGSDSSHI